MDKKEIYRYFIDLTKDQQVVFLDVINDLLTSQVTFTRLKEKYKDFSKFEKQMFKGLIEEIKARGINDISGTMLYKKIDYAKSKEVKEYFDTSLNQTISKLSRYTEFARTLM